MATRWALVVADFRREYGMDADELAELPFLDFQWLLQGLSKHARFLTAWAKAPKHVYDRDEIAAITAAARR